MTSLCNVYTAYIRIVLLVTKSRDNALGIATGYGLVGVRIPVGTW
jgi:hypothetical protein